ncbi:MAG: AAA family ATPase [Candidatus Pacebacteria bacterium]|nr:AAA family ATPase [Candidatus Paceibacterota bacterium]
MFKRLKIEEWRQYKEIDIVFHDRLTILTGANGSGKTTILNILNRHFGWSVNFVSTPKRMKNGVLDFLSGLWNPFNKIGEQPNEMEIGSVVYEDGKKGILKIPTKVSEVYQFSISDQQQVDGVHIPSHRPIFTHQHVETMPTKAYTSEQLFSNYSNEVKNRSIGGYSDRTPNYFLKEALISLVAFGYGNKKMSENRNAIELFEGFQGVLQRVLPPKLGFKQLLVEVPEIILDTNSGKFSLDSASGGVTAIIDLAWQVYTFSQQKNIKDKKFVITLDEPENHLHPDMQRRLLQNFIDAFPNAQFIVATHNPFIVTSVPDSNVYVLNYNEQNRVESFLLNTADKAASSNETLRDVLGLSSAMPLWAEQKIEEIVEKYSKAGLTEENFKSLRIEMTKLGFGEVIPETMGKIADKEHDTPK